MPQRGGSGNIYGVLFQILGAARAGITLRLHAERDGNDLASARLVIEPARGGGDLQVQGAEQRRVEQWKVTSRGRTWSLKKVVEDVLPDLYLGMVDDELAHATTYRFMTNGRQGRWHKAKDFFSKLSRDVIPLDVLASLDDPEEKHPLRRPDGRQQLITDRALFEQIVESVRGRDTVQNEPVDATRRKIWQLLPRFVLEPVASPDLLAEQIDHLLLSTVDCREDATAKRRELCGVLLELAGQGNVTVAPHQLLQDVGLDATPLANRSDLQARVHAQLIHDLKQLISYVPEQDVRDVAPWPVDRRILIIAGESGQGKSWRLAHLAMHASLGSEICVLGRATGNGGTDLQNVADIVWKSGLNHDRALTIDRLLLRVKEKLGFLNGPQLIIFVDDVQTSSESRDLIEYVTRLDGICLAMTAPVAVARAMRTQYPEVVETTLTGEFTDAEVTEYLEGRGVDWRQIPNDVRDVLHRPIMARLFCDNRTAGSWHATNEFEILEEFWERIHTAGNQADFPQDVVRLCDLAGTCLDADPQYPWDGGTLTRLEIDDESQNRLERIGWLRRLSEGYVEIWHDRLLNWAVAKALVQRYRSARVSIAELAATVADLINGNGFRAGRRLGYVPLDVLWLLCNPEDPDTSAAARLVEAIEDTQFGQTFRRRFYIEQLSALGTRVLPMFRARLEATADGDFNPYPQDIAEAAIAIGAKAPGEVQSWATEMLATSTLALQEAAFRILAKYPVVSATDRLWSLHRVTCKEKESDVRDPSRISATAPASPRCGP